MSFLLRFKCPKCGKVAEIPGDAPCPKCRTMITLPPDGVIQIHRNSKGYRSLERTRLFINGIPLGYMRDMDSIRIPVLYGHYSISMKYLGNAARVERGIPIEFDVTPTNRYVFLKSNVSYTLMSSTMSFEFTAPEEMPPLNI